MVIACSTISLGESCPHESTLKTNSSLLSLSLTLSGARSTHAPERLQSRGLLITSLLFFTSKTFLGQTFAHRAFQTATVESLVIPGVSDTGSTTVHLNTQSGRTTLTVVCATFAGAAEITGTGQLIRIFWGNPVVLLAGADDEIGQVSKNADFCP